MKERKDSKNETSMNVKKNNEMETNRQKIRGNAEDNEDSIRDIMECGDKIKDKTRHRILGPE